MKKMIKHMKWDVILTSLLYVALGIAALVMPGTMIETLGYLIGAFLIVAGAVSMICYLLRDARQNYFRNDFVYGLVGIAIGIIVLYQIESIVKLVPIILGVLVVASGCRKLQDVIDMKRLEYGNWVVMLIFAAVNVVFGVVLILNPFEAAMLLERLIGVGLIVSGAADCAIALYFAGKIQKYLDRVQTVDSTYVEIREAGGKADQRTEDKQSPAERKAGEVKIEIKPESNPKTMVEEQAPDEGEKAEEQGEDGAQDRGFAEEDKGEEVRK